MDAAEINEAKCTKPGFMEAAIIKSLAHQFPITIFQCWPNIKI